MVMYPRGKLAVICRPPAGWEEGHAFLRCIPYTYTRTVWAGAAVKMTFKTMLCLPEVANIPPTMPHKRTRSCQNGWWFSRMWTRSDDRSYLTKIPGTPWLPSEWLIVRFLSTTVTNNTMQHAFLFGWLAPCVTRWITGAKILPGVVSKRS